MTASFLVTFSINSVLSGLGIGFSNAFFLPDGTPNTAEQGRNTAPAARTAQPAQPKRVLLGRYLRVSPYRRTASIGPENPSVQPIPVARLSGPPKR